MVLNAIKTSKSSGLAHSPPVVRHGRSTCLNHANYIRPAVLSVRDCRAACESCSEPDSTSASTSFAQREPSTNEECSRRQRQSVQAISLATLQVSVCAFVPLAVGAEELATSSTYVPSPYSPGWEVWIGFAAGVIPFIIGGYEFTKRIVIQQRCQRCKGSGLVPKRNYRTERDLRKCPDCGGFFPWQGWGRFFTSTALPGNGGPLMGPKGQDSIFYKKVNLGDQSMGCQSESKKKGLKPSLSSIRSVGLTKSEPSIKIRQRRTIRYVK